MSVVSGYALRCYECIPGHSTGFCNETQRECPNSMCCAAGQGIINMGMWKWLPRFLAQDPKEKSDDLPKIVKISDLQAHFQHFFDSLLSSNFVHCFYFICDILL